MVHTFVITIVYLNLNSIFNILDAIKMNDFLKMFLRCWLFEPHFLINFFLIKKRVYNEHAKEGKVRREVDSVHSYTSNLT